MRYWKTFQKDLIKDIIHSCHRENFDYIMWQQHGSTRKVYKLQINKITDKDIHCSISKDSISKMGPVDKDQPIYFHIKHKDVIFKKDKYKHFNNILEITLPNEIQVYEKRKNQRFTYKYQDHKDITYESLLKNSSNEPEFTISSVLLDISLSGASMVVTDTIRERLAIGTQVLLLNLTDQKLPAPFKVTVKYINPYEKIKINGAHLFKVGLEFSDELDNVSYKSINSVIEKKATKVQGLDPKRFCGLDPEEQYKMISKIEQVNKQLANNIKDANEYLDRLRYMTTQMKIEFLKSISHDLLATALRLSTKELIYDLFIELTLNVREDFLEKLDREKPAAAINKAQDEIIAFLRQKEAKGEYILDPNTFESYV